MGADTSTLKNLDVLLDGFVRRGALTEKDLRRGLARLEVYGLLFPKSMTVAKVTAAIRAALKKARPVATLLVVAAALFGSAHTALAGGDGKVVWLVANGQYQRYYRSPQACEDAAARLPAGSTWRCVVDDV